MDTSASSHSTINIYTSDSDDDIHSSESDEEFYDLVALTANLIVYNEFYLYKEPCHTSPHKGFHRVRELLGGHWERSYDMLRMEPPIFAYFCEEFRKEKLLTDTKYVVVEEAMALFLIIIGKSYSMRDMREHFQRSGETCSRHFNRVLNAMQKYATMTIVPPSFDETPEYIATNEKFMPYFKDCIGALDGTHVEAIVPSAQKIAHLSGRKTKCTQNILAVCDFNMLFTFVSAGHEGTVHDSSILLECICSANSGFPMPPTGKYYLVDAGFVNTPGFLAPYRGHRYHLQERRGRNPQTKEEAFNYLHSSLRNIIERCFGVLKKRWRILNSMPSYSVRKQAKIVVAAMAVHNFIRRVDLGDELFREFSEHDMEFPRQVYTVGRIPREQERFAMNAFRDSLANGIFGH